MSLGEWFLGFPGLVGFLGMSLSLGLRVDVFLNHVGLDVGRARYISDPPAGSTTTRVKMHVSVAEAYLRDPVSGQSISIVR